MTGLVVPLLLLLLGSSGAALSLVDLRKLYRNGPVARGLLRAYGAVWQRHYDRKAR
jgi:hypothetical protein